MDKRIVAERLRALVSDTKKRSKAARLREVIDDVEATLAAGVSRLAVVEELSKHGLEMSLPTFDSTLRRIRQKRGKVLPVQAKLSEQPPGPAKPHGAIPVREVPAADNASPSASSHNPADINRIMSSTPDLDALAKLGKRKHK
jgi:hypothetical protein